MKKNLLAIVMGAVAAYMQQEDIGRAAAGIGMRQLIEQPELMEVRVIASVVRPQPGKGLWQRSRLE